MMLSRNFYCVTLSLILFILFQCCSSSFNPAAPYKSYTVVYGILSYDDTIHYIKIEKSFLSETNGNAYTEAQVADSIYYNNTDITASLIVYNSSNVAINTIPLTRVDADTLGQIKQPGVFADSPNIVYETKAPLLQDCSYKLKIVNNKTGKITSSETNIVNNFFFENPVAIYFDTSTYTTYEWEPALNAAIYQVVIYFYYEEINIANPADSSLHELTWTFPPQTNTQQSVYGHGFFTFVASQVPVNPAVERRAVYCNIWCYAGGSAFYTYQLVNYANSFNLVYGQVNPYYSNITNGLGLFSSTVIEKTDSLPIASNTRQELACSSYTQGLNFLSYNGKLCGQK